MDWILVIGLIVLFLGFSVFFGAPYVPSHRKDIQSLFEKGYPLKKSDVVVDFGSGDGVVLREVARQGAQAVGLEIHPLLILISWLASRRFGRKVRVRWTNAWHVSFPKETTVVYAFSVDRDGPRLLKKVQAEATRLEKPLTLICYGNPIDGMKPRTFGAYLIYTVKP